MQWKKFVIIIIGMSSIQYKHLLSLKGYTFGRDDINGIRVTGFVGIHDSFSWVRLICYNSILLRIIAAVVSSPYDTATAQASPDIAFTR